MGSLKKLIAEDALAIILVEQHAKVALAVTDSRAPRRPSAATSLIVAL